MIHAVIEATCGHISQLALNKSFNLDLDDVASSKLVLNVLGTSEASEDAALYHDSHLG